MSRPLSLILSLNFLVRFWMDRCSDFRLLKFAWFHLLKCSNVKIGTIWMLIAALVSTPVCPITFFCWIYLYIFVQQYLVCFLFWFCLCLCISLMDDTEKNRKKPIWKLVLIFTMKIPYYICSKLNRAPFVFVNYIFQITVVQLLVFRKP